MELSLDRLKKAEGSVWRGLPWLMIIVLAVAIVSLYWHQVETDKARNNEAKALRERLSAQEVALNQLQSATPVKNSKAETQNPGTSVKDLAARISSLESNVQEIEFNAEATTASIKSDFNNRLAALESESSPSNRIAGMQNQIVDLQTELDNLKQLIK